MSAGAVRQIAALAGGKPDPELWQEVSRDMFLQFRAMEGRGARDDAGGAARGARDEAGGAARGQAVGFRTVERMFTDAYSRVLPRFGLNAVPPESAVALVLKAHASAPPYPDVAPFLASVTRAYDVCVSSDADDWFLDRALTRASLGAYLRAGRVTSEGVRAYKAEEGGRFFEAVLALLGRMPEEVAHVGDGQSDVVGAKRAGLVAVWLCRDGRTWSRDDVLPDVVVRDLGEFARMLGAGVASADGE